MDVFQIKEMLDEGLVEAEAVCLITIATTLHWLDISKVMQLFVGTFSDKVVVAPVAYVAPEIMNEEIRSIFLFHIFLISH